MLIPHWWFHILRSLNKGVRNHNYCLTKHTINIHIYFIGTEIYPQKSQWIKFVLILNVANQEYERQNFTVKNYRSSNQQRERRNFTNDEWTYWRERHARAVAKNPRALKNGRGKVRFCLLGWRIYYSKQGLTCLLVDTIWIIRVGEISS